MEAFVVESDGFEGEGRGGAGSLLKEKLRRRPKLDERRRRGTVNIEAFCLGEVVISSTRQSRGGWD